MRAYEDLSVGDFGRSDTLVVSSDEMLDWARTYDPQWFHADPERAKDSVFGELVASGIYTAALWRRLDHQINQDVDFICGVAWKDTTWPSAVRAGDTLYATSEVVEKRPSTKHADRGIVTFDYKLFNQHDTLVFSCTSINLVRRRASADAAKSDPPGS